MRLLLTASITLFWLVTGPSAATPLGPIEARPELLIRLPDGRHLNFRCRGEGAPTVILEGGFAATSLAWTRVQRLGQSRYRLCAYDRAGYGFSDPGPMPRDGAAVVRDLNNALASGHIPGPYVLVGHSAGGLYVRLLAQSRRQDVVGLVLVDPSIEYQDQRFARIYGAGAGSLSPQIAKAERCLSAAQTGALPSTRPELVACAPPPSPGTLPAVTAARLAEARRPTTWLTQISELQTLWAQTSDEVAAGSPSFGDLPLTVLTADGTMGGPGSPGTAAWSALHREIASRSRRGRELTVTGSSHMMMFDRPDAIMTAIDEVVGR